VTTSNERRVVIAVVVTDRAGSLGRLLHSLGPIAGDPHVRLVVLDNGREPIPGEGRIEAPVPVSVIASSTPRLPLSQARLEVTRAVLDAGDQDEPIVWMIDDDLTFETLEATGGRLLCRNVASERLTEAREMARRDPHLDLVAGWFTGDPPIRPEAVVARQLADLSAELRRVLQGDVLANWPSVRLPTFAGDYYYDHAEPGRSDPPDQPYPWLPRGEKVRPGSEELARMLEAARSIRWGSTPFRPLVEQARAPEGAPGSVLRGGNCLFLRTRALRAHLYPSFHVHGVWSRRADMIGATLLARRPGFRAAQRHITLRHDRTGQRAFSAEIGPWLAEFAGVLLARLILGDVAEDRWEAEATQQARLRFERLEQALSIACAACNGARAQLALLCARSELPDQITGAATGLDRDLADLEATIAAVDIEAMEGTLLGGSLRRTVCSAARRLTAGEAACAGS
jgi:hypothetical protein